MKKKLAVVFSSDPEFGGGFQYSLCIWEAMKALDRETWEVRLISLSKTWAQIARADGLQIDFLPEHAGGNFIRRVLKWIPCGTALWRRFGRLFSPAMRALHAECPNLVIFPCESYLSFGTTLPTLVPIHDLMYIYERRFPEVGEPANFHRRRLLDLNICHYAHGILVDSETGRRQVLESYQLDPGRVHVLPYIPPPYLDGAVGRALSLPFKRYIFYPAQLWAHKNHAGLLRAMAVLRDKGLIVNAVFCGSEDNGTEGVFAEIKRLGMEKQVAHVGYVDAGTMRQLYDEAVALIMPTYFGPTNIPPLEAFTRGCPVAVSNVYGMPDQVGDAALLFDPSDDLQIATAIEKLWTDNALRTDLAARGRKRVEGLNQVAFNRQLIEILEKCTE